MVSQTKYTHAPEQYTICFAVFMGKFDLEKRRDARKCLETLMILRNVKTSSSFDAQLLKKGSSCTLKHIS